MPTLGFERVRLSPDLMLTRRKQTGYHDYLFTSFTPHPKEVREGNKKKNKIATVAPPDTVA